MLGNIDLLHRAKNKLSRNHMLESFNTLKTDHSNSSLAVSPFGQKHQNLFSRIDPFLLAFTKEI